MSEGISTNEVKFSYESRLVAFVDILGFRELINQSRSDHKALAQIISALVRLSVHRQNIGTQDSLMGFDTQLFSDSFILSCPITEENAFNLLSILNSLSWRLMGQDCWIRGGVTIGEMFVSDDIVVGPGIVAAADLERTLAEFPRVVLSSELLRTIEGYRLPIAELVNIERDADGVCFLNYIASLRDVLRGKINPPTDSETSTAVAIRDFILHRTNNTLENPRLFQKVQWVRTKWNKQFQDDALLRHLAV